MRIHISHRAAAAGLFLAAVGAIVAASLWPFAPASQSVAPVPVSQLGWAGPEGVEMARSLVERMPAFEIIDEERLVRDNSRKNARLWDAVQKVNGGLHLANVAQQVGDCVSWGYSNGPAYLYAVALVKKEATGSFGRPFPPYVYGTSRVLVGGGKLSGDGSVGAWAAEAVKRYGVLRSDAEGVPGYSGTLARQWGRSGPPKQFVDYASNFRIETVAKIGSAEQMREAVCNGYPVPICSNFGSRTFRVVDNRRVANGDDSWNHCMTVVAYDGSLGPGREYFYVLNSWGPNAHPAPLQGEPPGGFWITWEQAERIARQGDSFALSNFRGFPARSIDFELLAATEGDDEGSTRGRFRNHPGRGRGFVPVGSGVGEPGDGGLRTSGRQPAGQLGIAGVRLGRGFGSLRTARGRRLPIDPGRRVGRYALGGLGAGRADVRAEAVAGTGAVVAGVSLGTALDRAADLFAVSLGLQPARRGDALGSRVEVGAAVAGSLLQGQGLRALQGDRPDVDRGAAAERMADRAEPTGSLADRDLGDGYGPLRRVRRRADADLRPDQGREGSQPEGGPVDLRNGWVRPSDVPDDHDSGVHGLVPGGGGEEPPGLSGEAAAREWSIARWLARQLIDAIAKFFEEAVEHTMRRLFVYLLGMGVVIAAAMAIAAELARSVYRKVTGG